MNTTSRAARLQQKHIKRIQAECDSYTFFNVLTDDVLFNRLEELLPEHRERRFPPTETLSMFLTQVMSSDRSCQNIVNKRAIKHTLTGVSGFSVSTGGYCRARQRLPCELVSSLACCRAQNSHRSFSPNNGRRIMKFYSQFPTLLS